MFYLYRHIRLDKNEPFYIGIGKERLRNNQSLSALYERAYTKNGRNKLWKKIILITQYRIEIVFESDNKKIIEKKEKEFINLYGRIDLNTGILCNMTDGGEGIQNPSLKRREKISKK